MLTPSDVEQKTFSTALRGYDLDEVDDFLDEVVATIRQLTEQLEEARTATEAVPEPAPVLEPEPEPVLEPEPAPEPIAETPKPDIDESAIGRALIAAQNTADKLLDDARSEADRIRELARSEADSWTEEREAKRREAEAEIQRLTERVASVRSELAVLAGEVSSKLDEMDGALEGVGVTDTGSVIDSEDQGESAVEALVGEGVEEPFVAETASENEHGDEETSDQGGGGSDHLDEMLSGVVNDLRLSPGQHGTGSDDYHADEDEEQFDEDE